MVAQDLAVFIGRIMFDFDHIAGVKRANLCQYRANVSSNSVEYVFDGFAEAGEKLD